MSSYKDNKLPSSEELALRLAGEFERGGTIAERYVDFGSPLWNRATRGLRSGIFYIGGMPNMGKSAVLVSKMVDILQCNSDVAVLDFTLDESFEQRIHRIVSNISGVEINDIAFAAALPDAARVRREDGFKKVNRWIRDGRLVISEASEVQALTDELEEFRRRLGDDVKIVATIDGMHNVLIQRSFSDSLFQQEEIAKAIQVAHHQTRSIILASAHVKKMHGQRNTSMQDIKGSGALSYNATIISMVYCDVKVKRNAANIFYVERDRPEKLPVIEVDVMKNKASVYNDIIFHTFIPELARVAEMDEAAQAQLKTRIFSGMRAQ